MAELPNREQLESNFAKRFGKLARRQQREIKRLFGDPPDFQNIPEQFWLKMQRETDAELYAILLLIFDESAIYHGWDTPESGLAAYGWAKQRADEFSKYWVESTQTRIERGLAKLQKPEPIDESTVEAARAANRLSGGNGTGGGKPSPVASGDEPFSPANRVFPGQPPIKVPTKEEIDDLLDDAFGAKRIETNAVDETTRARHAGGESAVEETVGISQDDEWQNNPEDSVTGPCKICKPLNNLKRSEWPWRYREGPPSPHRRCCCSVRYKFVSLPDAIGRMIDDPDYKSLKAFDPSESRDESGKWTAGSARSQLHKQAAEMGTHLTPSASHVVISHPETRTVRSGLWGAVASAGDGSERDEYSIKPDPEEPSAHNLYWTHYSNGHKADPQMVDSFDSVDEAKAALQEEMAKSVRERTEIHPLSSQEKRTGNLEKWQQKPTKFGKEFEPSGEHHRDEDGEYIGPDYGGMTLDDLHVNSRKSMPRFNLKSWFRQIPNAAEWRAYARENGIDMADRAEFSRFASAEFATT